MKKKLITQKRDEMKSWSARELVDYVANYEDQEALKYDEDGEKRYPNLSAMAEVIQENNYEMSDAQYYSMLDNFTKVIIPQMKVVGVSFRDPNVENMNLDKVFERGVLTKYEVNYLLEPEPDNPYDANAVKVLVEGKEGNEHIGYVAAPFVAKHQITEPMRIEGMMSDHSNGHFSNLSYDIEIDTEALQEQRSRISNLQIDMGDLLDLEDEGLEQ